jgi:hypothetical protein
MVVIDCPCDALSPCAACREITTPEVYDFDPVAAGIA